MSRLRHFQQDVQDAGYLAWDEGAKVIMPVMCTGAGKTVLVGDTARKHDGYGVAIAHRSELVGQISMALAKEGVRHDIIAPKATIRTIVNAHMDEIGRTYYDGRSNWKIASVDTIVRRELDPRWTSQVTLAIQDEGHHVLRENKWGRAFAIFPNARGMFVTATPERADGKGLGSHADGLVDKLILGPPMRWMINAGFLTDYKIIAPPLSELNMEGVEISPTTGDYNQDQMRARVKANTKIIGDVVKTYLEHARGKLGITFAVDVEHATDIAAAYNKAGVPAVVVHAETPELERRQYMQRFMRRELLQLVNVDLYGEGVDVPMLEVVSFARPTASYSLFVQQFGRVLRLMLSPILQAAWDTYTDAQRLQMISESAKPYGLVIDHVGNVILHNGPPDWRTDPWSLDARDRRKRNTDSIPLRYCANPMCMEPYERIYPACPWCGWEPPLPTDRSKPEHVDGDMILYTQELLEQLFGQKKKVDGPCLIPYGADALVTASVRKNHATRQQAQAELRQVMSLYLPPGLDERVAQRRFFHTFGVDTLTAQGLGSTDANNLRQRIIDKLRAVK